MVEEGAFLRGCLGFEGGAGGGSGSFGLAKGSCLDR